MLACRGILFFHWKGGLALMGQSGSFEGDSDMAFFVVRGGRGEGVGVRVRVFIR